MCVPDGNTASLQPSLFVLVFPMEYPLPGPVVALLQQENASLAPKSYFISSGKKSIKITLVYSKGEAPIVPIRSSSAERKKPRHGSSSKPTSKPTRRTRNKNLSESSSSTNNEQTDSVSQSDVDQASASPDLPHRDDHQRDRERLSTVDSGHPPSSSGTIANEHEAESESGSEAGDEGDEQGCDSSVSSSDSEKPRTPGREIAVPASSIGPGETPAARRDEMWQTWTRIPRTQASDRKLLAAPLSAIRRSLSPSTAFTQRTVTTTITQPRLRLHEGVSWEGSGNL